MQKAGKFYCFSILFVVFINNAPAQVTATAGVSASIVVPIGISKEIDLDFGNIAAGNSNGFVVLKPDGSREQSGGATLPSLTGNVTAAEFNITGAPGYLYSISLPGAPVTISNGSDDMLVDQFASDPPVTGTLGSNGYQKLSVGATLLVGALQPVGDYLSPAEFNVTVNYN